jgi:hypothetical protein
MQRTAGTLIAAILLPSISALKGTKPSVSMYPVSDSVYVADDECDRVGRWCQKLKRSNRSLMAGVLVGA